MSSFLEKVLVYIQEHADVERGDITVEIKNEDASLCRCKREYSVGECCHGRPFSDKVLSVSVSVKDWDSFGYEKNTVCYWREVTRNGKVFILPFRFQESFPVERALPQIISVVGKHEFRQYRRTRLQRATQEVVFLEMSLVEKEQKILSLEKEKEGYENLLAELYAPGGALAKEAEKNFENLTQ
ncbi:hypothetical protein PMV_017 [Port-miou virus]|uniref:Uncharacterized protein n=1 Tax=Port-miou virus TaxID=1733873 RepID=A0A0N9P6E3_9VIRU|nr:hypothetical protein PMV_017 [Port-miou virus]